MDKLTASLMGIDGPGLQLLEALQENPQIRLAAVADRNPDVLAKVAENVQCELYDDYRQLVVQARTDLLFVTAPPYAGNEYAKLAAERGSHVWQMPPIANGFDQAVALVDAVARAERMLLIGTAWRLSRPYQVLMDHRDAMGGLFLARASLVTFQPSPLGWRGDSARAGGGVLLNHAYDAVDCMVQLMGMPDDVVATCSRLARTQTAQSYDTEDTAVVLLRYPKGATGLITTSWLSSPPEQAFCLHGSGATAVVDERGLCLRNSRGKVLVQIEHDCANPFHAQVREVLQATATGEPGPLPTGCQQLQTTAVIEAAYLSARTGQPESPAELLRLHGISGPPAKPKPAAAPKQEDSPHTADEP